MRYGKHFYKPSYSSFVPHQAYRSSAYSYADSVKYPPRSRFDNPDRQNFRSYSYKPSYRNFDSYPKRESLYPGIRQDSDFYQHFSRRPSYPSNERRHPSDKHIQFYFPQFKSDRFNRSHRRSPPDYYRHSESSSLRSRVALPDTTRRRHYSDEIYSLATLLRSLGKCLHHLDNLSHGVPKMIERQADRLSGSIHPSFSSESFRVMNRDCAKKWANETVENLCIHYHLIIDDFKCKLQKLKPKSESVDEALKVSKKWLYTNKRYRSTTFDKLAEMVALIFTRESFVQAQHSNVIRDQRDSPMQVTSDPVSQISHPDSFPIATVACSPIHFSTQMQQISPLINPTIPASQPVIVYSPISIPSNEPLGPAVISTSPFLVYTVPSPSVRAPNSLSIQQGLHEMFYTASNDVSHTTFIDNQCGNCNLVAFVSSDCNSVVQISSDNPEVYIPAVNNPLPPLLESTYVPSSLDDSFFAPVSFAPSFDNVDDLSYSSSILDSSASSSSTVVKSQSISNDVVNTSCYKSTFSSNASPRKRQLSQSSPEINVQSSSFFNPVPKKQKINIKVYPPFLSKDSFSFDFQKLNNRLILADDCFKDYRGTANNCFTHVFPGAKIEHLKVALDKVNDTFENVEFIFLYFGYNNREQTCSSTIAPYTTSLITSLSKVFPKAKIIFSSLFVPIKLSSNIKNTLTLYNAFLKQKLHSPAQCLDLPVDISNSIINVPFLPLICDKIVTFWLNSLN